MRRSVRVTLRMLIEDTDFLLAGRLMRMIRSCLILSSFLNLSL